MQKTSLMDLLNKSSGTAASAYESKEHDVCFDTVWWQRLTVIEYNKSNHICKYLLSIKGWPIIDY